MPMVVIKTSIKRPDLENRITVDGYKNLSLRSPMTSVFQAN